MAVDFLYGDRHQGQIRMSVQIKRVAPATDSTVEMTVTFQTIYTIRINTYTHKKISCFVILKPVIEFKVNNK